VGLPLCPGGGGGNGGGCERDRGSSRLSEDGKVTAASHTQCHMYLVLPHIRLHS
jgi:hypothetical protein